MIQTSVYEHSMPEYQFNLSDFALFLSVMKNKRAYECTLSIILDEPDIKIQEVKVEQVILNKSGKRAIRLDAWATSTDQRQFNMEMQNDRTSDDLAKRSRYYQSMIDTPILKSGKKTKYRRLPSTVIIFITQDDIFGQDRAKYTFTEQCLEVNGLQLTDGAKKIFLNMSSKNGSQELISLLQYMKETRIDNPNIIVHDSRILELDSIVTEVRESEEWEVASMSFMDLCIDLGIKRGEYLTLLPIIRKQHNKGLSIAEIADLLGKPEEYIQDILDRILMNPDWSDEKIVNEMFKKS